MSIYDYWKKYKENGDRESKEKIIIEYIELVKIIAGRLYVNYNGNVDYDDLVSYGILGLIDAIDKFDLSKNVKFETYANIRIRGAIVDQMRNLDWIPRSIRQKYKKVEDAVKKLQNIYGDDIKDEYLAKEMNVSLEELYEILNDISGLVVVSLDEFLQNGKNFDISSGSKEINPQEALEKKESEKLIKEVIENLPEKEKKVISLYYYSELTYKEIANVIGISESRVSQLHTSAIAKLKIKLKF